MKLNPLFIYLLFVFLGCRDTNSSRLNKAEKVVVSEPTVSFTFDDGSTSDIAHFKFEEWNEMILTQLEANKLKAVFFVTGKNKRDTKGQFLLNSWNDRGHSIANHSFTHPYFNAEENTSDLFERELLRTDSLISKLGNKVRLFRFPYLKEGQTESKIDSLRKILAAHNYQNGYVTIDASDWYVNSRLISRIHKNGFAKTDIDRFKDFYLHHITDRANYYEKLSYELNKRHVHHTLLLHHNLTSALFLDDLIDKFKEEGWAVINADTAYQDKIFDTIPDSRYAGESLIYSLAKQSGKYDQSLRYPAEDSRYEKKRMDELGL